MKKQVALLLLSAVTILFSVAAVEEPTTFRIANTSVRIPSPNGFYRYDGKDAQVDTIARRLVGNNRLLAAYSSGKDLEQVLHGHYPKLERSFTAQTDPKLEAIEFDRELLSLLKDKLRHDFSDGLKSYGPTIKEVEADGSAAAALSQRLTALKLGEMIPLGIFDETPDSVCFSMIIKAQAVSGGPDQPPPYTGVSAVCMTRVDNRILSLGCGSQYRSKSDIMWARSSLQEWRNSILSANER